MNKNTIALMLILLLLLTGCINFTKYKTGKVLKKHERTTTVGEFIIKKDSDGSEMGIIPKAEANFGLGKGFEIDMSFNWFLIGAELRKQILYEEKQIVNLSADAGIHKGIGMTSLNTGITISKTFKNEVEPYIGIRVFGSGESFKYSNYNRIKK